MKLFAFVIILSLVITKKFAIVIIPSENYTEFRAKDTEEFKKFFFDLEGAPIPPSNCLNASIDNPSLLIYCLVIALIWLATVSTGLFFYFRAIFRKLTVKLQDKDIELQVLPNNGLQPNRNSVVVK